MPVKGGGTFQNSELLPEIKTLLEERKKAKRAPLTIEKIRQTPGLENFTETEASEAVESIKQLAKIFFELACQNENTCIDNQQVVCLNQHNKAA